MKFQLLLFQQAANLTLLGGIDMDNAKLRAELVHIVNDLSHAGLPQGELNVLLPVAFVQLLEEVRGGKAGKGGDSQDPGNILIGHGLDDIQPIQNTADILIELSAFLGEFDTLVLGIEQAYALNLSDSKRDNAYYNTGIIRYFAA